MKTLVAVVALSCCAFPGFQSAEEPSSVAIQQETTENVGFKWAFGAMVGSAKERRLVSVTRDTVLNTGDEIKMCVELTKECYVYVVYAGSRGEMALMFPYNLKQFDGGDYKTAKNYYIPAGRKWSELDKNVGRETFYVLAAAERLNELEASLANYLSADEAKKAQFGDQVLTEIRNVKKRFRTFTTLAEKPITIGGNVRSLEKAEEVKRPDVSTIAVQISANNFYSKTFTIDHK